MNLFKSMTMATQAPETLRPVTVNVAKEFSLYPGERYRKHGPHSGEAFREELLEPRFKQALEQGQKLLVNLDGTDAYGTSFLEEAFGGLARQYGAQEVLARLELQTLDEPLLEYEIETYIRNAAQR